MKTRHPSGYRIAAITPFVATVALAFTPSSWADDPNPYYLGVSASYGHDSNVFRAPTSAQGDSSWSAGLLGGIDQPFGRQRFYASGNVRSNRYENLTSLNYTSYGLNAALDWSTIERLSGTLSVAASENLANYSSNVTQVLNTKNIEKNSQFLAQAQWGMVSLLSLVGSVTHRQTDYSAVEYSPYNVKQDVGSIGLRYRPSGLLTLGTAVRLTRGRYTDRLDTNGDQVTFRRRDIDLTAAWIASGQSTINARVSFGRQTTPGASRDDFSGTTGLISWAYVPTGKLSFNTSLSRDTGLESTFQNIVTPGGPGTALGDTSRLTTAVSLDANYAATAKIKATARARYSHRSLSEGFTSSGQSLGSASGTDNVVGLSVGVSYAPTRSMAFSCNLGRESRKVSDGTPLGLSYPFSANTASCSAQLVLQ